MKTIVCNTITGAVSEYTRHTFQSLTPTHGGSASGLFALDGDTDDGLPIVAEINLPATLRDDTLKAAMEVVYLSMHGDGSAELIVFGNTESWSYPFYLRESGQTRCKVGRGIKENYLGIGIQTPDGQAFRLDRAEVRFNKSKNRRT